MRKLDKKVFPFIWVYPFAGFVGFVLLITALIGLALLGIIEDKLENITSLRKIEGIEIIIIKY
jgi:hypothetical protein